MPNDAGIVSPLHPRERAKPPSPPLNIYLNGTFSAPSLNTLFNRSRSTFSAYIFFTIARISM